MATLLPFIIELSVCSNLAPGYCATKFTSLVFPHFISPDEEITNLTVNIVKHTMPAIILIKLREDIKKKNCRFGENFIIYLTLSPLMKE